MHHEYLSNGPVPVRQLSDPASEMQTVPMPPYTAQRSPSDVPYTSSPSRYLSLWSPNISYKMLPVNSTTDYHRYPSKTLLYDVAPSYSWNHTLPLTPHAHPQPALTRSHQEGQKIGSRAHSPPTASILAVPVSLPVSLPAHTFLSADTSSDMLLYGSTLVARSAFKTSRDQDIPTKGLAIDELLERLQSGERERTSEKNRLLTLRGAAARSMLDALQMWLDRHLEHPDRRKILRLLVDIAAASNELPRSLFVSGVLVPSPRPVKYGGFADVFYGTLNGRPVAIKRLRINDDEHGNIFKDFCKEGLLWRQLSHPNVLPFIGVDGNIDGDSPSFSMISPWMKRGTIMFHVRSNEYNPRVDRQRLITEIAEGLLYLHGQGIAHGDLHGGNVLITDDGHACLTDFGMTVIGDLSRTHHSSSRSSAGVNRWLAPEVFLPDPILSRKTPAGDVFSFGRICLAICTTRPPFPETPDRCMYHLIYHGEHPSRPSEADCGGFAMSDMLWDLANECWEMDPAKRPRMNIVLLRLQRKWGSH